LSLDIFGCIKICLDKIRKASLEQVVLKGTATGKGYYLKPIIAASCIAMEQHSHL
jgi:hypothetical protein